MTFPDVPPIDLLHTGKELGFHGAELRNDIRSDDPLDGFSAGELRAAADSSNQVIFSINALQHCNDGSIGTGFAQYTANTCRNCSDTLD